MSPDTEIQWPLSWGLTKVRQTPPNAGGPIFLGTETAVFYGLEQWSRRYDMAVVFGKIRRDGPWRYSVAYELVTKDASALNEGEVSRSMFGHVGRSHFGRSSPLALVAQTLETRPPRQTAVSCSRLSVWRRWRGFDLI